MLLSSRRLCIKPVVRQTERSTYRLVRSEIGKSAKRVSVRWALVVLDVLALCTGACCGKTGSSTAAAAVANPCDLDCCSLGLLKPFGEALCTFLLSCRWRFSKPGGRAAAGAAAGGLFRERLLFLLPLRLLCAASGCCIALKLAATGPLAIRRRQQRQGPRLQHAIGTENLQVHSEKQRGIQCLRENLT